MTTIQSIIRTRAESGLADLLLEVYDHAYCAGAGMERPPLSCPGMADLIATLEARHRVERLREAGDGHRESGGNPATHTSPQSRAPSLHDELPGWLLALRQQADTIEPPPVEGWPI